MLDGKYLKSVIKYTISAIIAVLLITYILYHISGGFDTEISASAANIATQERTVTTTAYIMRNETIVSSPVNGAVSYIYSDGEKVPVNTPIAEVYSSSAISEEKQKRIVEINQKIKLLKASNMSRSEQFTDTNTTDTLIENNIFSYLSYADSGDITAARAKADNLLIQLNRRRIIVGSTQNYDAQIASLNAEKASLYGSSGAAPTQIISEKPGYFWSVTDGYEGIFTSNAVENMTFSSYHSLIMSEPKDHAATSAGYPIGKIVTDFEWHIACEINRSELHRFVTGGNYGVRFSVSGGTLVSMKLQRVLTDISSDTAVLIFVTGDMPENLRYIRKQTVQLVSNEYTGYRVPVSAVRLQDGTTGVYVLRGSLVMFKKIEILCESDGYYIVSDNASHSNDSGSWLNKNDFIIFEGKDLYDGKIIT